MSKNIVVVLLVSVVGIFWFVDSSDHEEKIEAQKTERKSFEEKRVLTFDPISDLAGCMANHSTTVTQMFIAQVILKHDKSSLPQEDMKKYEEIRDALYDKCAQKYYSSVIEKYGALKISSLNYVFMDVMRNDPYVQAHLALLNQLDGQIKEARKSIYVK